MDGEFSNYDHGWRRGIFDKCNGIDRKLESDWDWSVSNEIWFAGYDDAYDSHERRI